MPRTSHRTKPTPPTSIDPTQRYSLAEASAILRQSTGKTFQDMREGRLAVIREGRRTYVHGSELIRRSAIGSPVT